MVRRVTAIEDAVKQFVFIEAKVFGKPTKLAPPRCYEVEGDLGQPGPCSHADTFHTADPRQSEFDGSVGYERTNCAAPRGWRWTKDYRLELKPDPRRKFEVEIPERTRENIAACAALGLGYWSERPGKVHRGRLVWAIDDQRRAHSIEVNTDLRVASHVCGESWAVLNVGELQECPDIDKSEMYGIPSTMQLIYPKEEPVPGPAPDKVPRKKRNPLINGPDNPFKQPAFGSPEHEAQVTADVIARAKSPQGPTPADIAEYGPNLKARVEDGCTPRPKAKPTKTSYSAPKKVGMTITAAVKLLHHDPDYLADIPNERLVEILDIAAEKMHHPKIRVELRARGLTEARAK